MDTVLLERIVSIVVAVARPVKVLLFGSFARGEAGPDSDIDLIVVEREPFGGSRSRHKEICRISRALEEIRTAIDVLVYSESEFERYAGYTNHVVANAVREGRVLYAA